MADFDLPAPFRIEQSDADGSISVVNLPFIIHGEAWRLYRPLNSRQPWPLWAEPEDEDGDTVAVFDDNGRLSEEFWQLISENVPA